MIRTVSKGRRCKQQCVCVCVDMYKGCTSQAVDTRWSVHDTIKTRFIDINRTIRLLYFNPLSIFSLVVITFDKI